MQDSLNSLLVVLPTSRAKRDLAKSANGFIQKALTIGEFEERAVYLEDRVFIDETSRLLLLRKASDFVGYDKLNIDRDFLVFLEHAPFFLRFYDELFSEKVEIDNLLFADTYAEYDSHLAVLKTLLKNYKDLLDKNSYADKIFLVDNYKINSGFIKEFDEIYIVLDGALSRFELNLFEKISQITTVKLELELNRFDEKIKKTFDDFDLELGYKYLLDFTQKKIVKKDRLDLVNSAEIYALKNRSLQIAALKETIYSIVKNGTDPSEIAVVLPDESFAPIVQSYDYKNNFNFSMGTPFSTTKFYLDLIALYNHLTKAEKKDNLFFKRVSKISSDLMRFRDIIRENSLVNSDEKIALFYELNELANSEQKEIADLVFSKITSIIKDENLSLIEILHIYIDELKRATIDDIRGGKITVIGALESRSADFKAVIVIDFNDEFVPIKNIKDMFLNSFVRKIAGLPTRYDRENLQRSLYYKLFSKSQKNIIFCVDNETSKPSRFLKEIYLDTPIKPFSFNDLYLFDKVAIEKIEESEIELEIDLTSLPLSATKFNTYIECKREFYYRYIKKYRKSEELEEDSQAQTVGNLLHNALKIAMKRSYNSKRDLIDNIIDIAKKEADSKQLIFELDLWAKKLDSFAFSELKRRENGAVPVHLEESFKTVYKGINIEGKIDRVDSLDNGFVVLDYKSGKIPEMKNINKIDNFQLVFYYLLIKAEYNKPVVVGYYDLSCGTIYYYEELDPLIERFDYYLEEYKNRVQKFSKTDTQTACRYCDYTALCKRFV